jgi:hypothetical protein
VDWFEGIDRFRIDSHQEPQKVSPILSFGGEAMCYNCGCGMPNNDMGKKENITNKTFEEAARVMDQSPEEAKKNAHALLERVFAAPTQSKEKNWKP